jgi:hypothetical protein
VEKLIEEVLAFPHQPSAEAIPGARFEVLAEEAHQPFQEVPDLFNATADTFWREIEARYSAANPARRRRTGPE